MECRVLLVLIVSADLDEKAGLIGLFVLAEAGHSSATADSRFASCEID
jgi:hypothetical protein